MWIGVELGGVGDAMESVAQQGQEGIDNNSSNNSNNTIQESTPPVKAASKQHDDDIIHSSNNYHTATPLPPSVSVLPQYTP